MTKQRIIDGPSQWIITKNGDFVRIRDSEIRVDKKLEAIREHLKTPFRGKVRFQEKTSEQISKERYDKVWEEVNFDTEKLHEWLYDKKNKDKVEIVKLESQDFSEAAEAIFNHVKSRQQKWRIRWGIWRNENEGREIKLLVNEETGQIIYYAPSIEKKIEDLYWEEPHERSNGIPTLINNPTERVKIGEEGEKIYNSVMIFLHGTYKVGDSHFSQIEKNFPNTKFIYPYSPTLQYDMWHGSDKAPGGQCEGWINITGDAWELMEADVPKAYNLYNPPSRKNFEEADKVIHLDYPQLMRAVSYVNEIIEDEIASGIPSEKIFISGYSQGGFMTLAIALTSQHKLGGFIPLCGLLPRWDKLLVNPSDKNKKTPCLIVNNSGDPWVPFWTGKKSYDLLKERGYNVEFKTRPGRGHGWENEDIEDFLKKCLYSKNPFNDSNQQKELWSDYLPLILGGVGIVILVTAVVIIYLQKRRFKKEQGKETF